MHTHIVSTQLLVYSGSGFKMGVDNITTFRGQECVCARVYVCICVYVYRMGVFMHVPVFPSVFMHILTCSWWFWAPFPIHTRQLLCQRQITRGWYSAVRCECHFLFSESQVEDDSIWTIGLINTDSFLLDLSFTVCFCPEPGYWAVHSQAWIRAQECELATQCSGEAHHLLGLWTDCLERRLSPLMGSLLPPPEASLFPSVLQPLAWVGM